MRWALVIVLLAGCRQVLGLDPPRIADSAVDAGPQRIQGKLALEYVENSPETS